MYYTIALLIPLVIIAVIYFFRRPINSFKSFVKLYSYSFLSILIYAGIIYFLEKNLILETGWGTYTLVLFLIPALLILIIFQLIIYFKKK